MTVASFTDAWIETTLAADRLPVLVVASFTDAWIETREIVLALNFCRIFYRCVD